LAGKIKLLPTLRKLNFEGRRNHAAVRRIWHDRPAPSLIIEAPREQGLPVPQANPDPKITIENEKKRAVA
jgi:hypothetical protein